MKRCIVLVLLLAASGCWATNEVFIIPDRTPDITNVVWNFTSSPGTYFWNGFSLALVLGLVAVLVSGLRSVTGPEEE